MNQPSSQRVYNCDFRTSDGSILLSYQAVTFLEKPTDFVRVDDKVFKNAMKSDSFFVYLEVPITDLSSQVQLNG